MCSPGGRVRVRIATAIVLAIGAWLAREAVGSFVTFETGQVRPLALTAGGTRLLALNTPDARLEIFAVDKGDLSHIGSVPVGLEPVAVAARTGVDPPRGCWCG